MDDDDDFLYGEPTGAQTVVASEPSQKSPSNIQASNGLNAQLETQSVVSLPHKTPPPETKEDEDDEDEDEVDLGEESDEDEIEIIMEPVARSLDFRNQNQSKPPTSRTTTTTLAPPTQPKALAQQPNLTTEYNVIRRGDPLQPTSSSSSVTQSQQEPTPAPFPPAPGLQPQTQPLTEETSSIPDDGVDTSTLPPAEAPPSAPAIDPNATGVFDGRPILEVDLNALADKPWRRPGSDISDWFNYGFDEISWEAYCYRRRDVGDLATVLKTNVINFAAMPEEQLTALPPEVRTMVMTGASAMMGNAGANPGMMGPGMMMDMSGMMGPMGMNMNGDMGMGGGMMQGMLADGPQGQQGGVGVGIVPGNGTPEQVSSGVGMMQDGFNPGAMNLGMGNEYVLQEQGPMVQQMYPVMEAQNVPSVPSGRGTSIPFRGGRGAPGLGGRGRGFTGRGRGRGFDAPPPVPVRPASPLPPGVPTGPRNQNKYKDRDGNAPAVDGLDYGGGKDALGRRTPSEQPEERDRERSSGRKRRSSPGLDDIRGSKRR